MTEPEPRTPPQQPAPPPQPGVPQQPAVPQGPYPYGPPVNMYAILALVFGAFVLPPLGIYFGVKAKQQIAQTGERGHELAQAGLIVGVVFTCLYAAFFLVWCGFASVMLGSLLNDLPER